MANSRRYAVPAESLGSRKHRCCLVDCRKHPNRVRTILTRVRDDMNDVSCMLCPTELGVRKGVGGLIRQRARHKALKEAVRREREKKAKEHREVSQR